MVTWLKSLALRQACRRCSVRWWLQTFQPPVHVSDSPCCTVSSRRVRTLSFFLLFSPLQSYLPPLTLCFHTQKLLAFPEHHLAQRHDLLACRMNELMSWLSHGALRMAFYGNESHGRHHCGKYRIGLGIWLAGDGLA